MPHDPDVLDAVVKAYDVRGLTDTQLTPDLVHALGVAAASVIADGGPFLIGWDMRPSSPVLVDAFARGLTEQGTDVVELGLASTDLVSYASGVLDAPAAMFTASHNPAGYNGIKLCRAAAVPVAIDTGLGELKDRVLAGGPEPLPTDERGRRTERDLLPDFAVHVRSFVDADVLRPVRVAVDAGNGMAGHVWPAVVEGLPIETTPLYFELDGTFPNHPANPLEPDNLRDLQAAVRDGGHALGLAFDGDADRVFAVDERGRPVASALIGAVVADRLLRQHPGETVLHNLICSRVVPETIEAAGGIAVRTRVGHSFIKRRMAESGAIYAVEHSGHFYFRDHYRADSGLVAALVLLEAVAAADAPLSEVIAPYDRYPSSGERNFTVDDPAAVVDRVAESFAERGSMDREDGLTVVLDDGWFNLRPSNTEPLLRLNVEGDDVAALDRIEREVAAHLVP
ncbi:phosphomannomutase/phosphoglucomutase [soil metagenome]